MDQKNSGNSGLTPEMMAQMMAMMMNQQENFGVDPV